MFGRSLFSVSSPRSSSSFPLQEMAARDPDLQLDEKDPLLAYWDPMSRVTIPSRGFACLNLPRQQPQSFVDPGHWMMHVCMKINDKPGGLNSKLEVENSPANLLISRVPTLIIGMGVSHPPGNPDGPSIAVVVHSRTWPVMSEYRGFSCTKPPKVDMIDSLYKPVLGDDGETKDVGIMREVLQDFEESTGMRNPEHIIIFRYGVSVSESLLTLVLEAELDQISEACKFFDNEWSPKFAVIRFLVLDALENSRIFTGDIRCVSKIDDSVPARVVVDRIGLSPDEVEGLVDSLSYVNRLRAEMISMVAPLCGPPKSAESVEPGPKRVKARKELDGDELKSERDFIVDGEELALYVLGKLNAEKGGKYKFEKYLGSNWNYCWKEYPDGKKWSHVSMYAQESNGENVCQESNGKNVCQEPNGENVCRKIIFAELCYSDGKYESVNATVLEPNKPEEIRYGCGFCSPGYAGEQKNPHPADPSAYTMGHWIHCINSWIHRGYVSDAPTS